MTVALTGEMVVAVVLSVVVVAAVAAVVAKSMASWPRYGAMALWRYGAQRTCCKGQCPVVFTSPLQPTPHKVIISNLRLPFTFFLHVLLHFFLVLSSTCFFSFVAARLFKLVVSVYVSVAAVAVVVAAAAVVVVLRRSE